MTSLCTAGRGARRSARVRARPGPGTSTARPTSPPGPARSRWGRWRAGRGSVPDRAPYGWPPWRGTTDVKAGSGDVTLGEVAADVGVRTGTGAVQVSDARAGRVELTSGSGRAADRGAHRASWPSWTCRPGSAGRSASWTCSTPHHRASRGCSCAAARRAGTCWWSGLRLPPGRGRPDERSPGADAGSHRASTTGASRRRRLPSRMPAAQPPTAGSGAPLYFVCYSRLQRDFVAKVEAKLASLSTQARRAGRVA